MTMQPLSALSPQRCQQIQTIFSDLDDTLTNDGRLSDVVFSSIWRAHRAGISVVIVTGRPAGWCDHLARMWPVAGVIGENGALAFRLEQGRMKRLFMEPHEEAASRLAVLRDEILTKVPRSRVAADQPYRLYDLAIDISEEVEPLDRDDIDRIVEICHRHGATAKISSIHINTWFGVYDKLSMCRRFSDELLGKPLDPEQATFVGDSPNDAPMFRAFPYAVGVANLRNFLDRMDALPAFITPSEGGYGFSELVDHVLHYKT